MVTTFGFMGGVGSERGYQSYFWGCRMTGSASKG